MEVRSGEIYGFLVPNGAGKSTTPRVLLGLFRRDAGSDVGLLDTYFALLVVGMSFVVGIHLVRCPSVPLIVEIHKYGYHN